MLVAFGSGIKVKQMHMTQIQKPKKGLIWISVGKMMPTL